MTITFCSSHIVPVDFGIYAEPTHDVQTELYNHAKKNCPCYHLEQVKHTTMNTFFFFSRSDEALSLSKSVRRGVYVSPRGYSS